MPKTKRNKFVLVGIIIFSLVAMYGFMPLANAASLESVKDTISDSAPSVYPLHTIVFDMGTELAQNEYVQITFDGSFGAAGGASTTCPTNTTASAGANYVQCTVNATFTLASTSPQTILIENVQSPGITGSYTVTVSTHQSGGAQIESSNLKIAIVDEVTVTATVDATLQFDVRGIATGTVVNTITTTGSTTATEIAFQTIDDTASSTLAQQLEVTTNADGGYIVTVEQDQDMVNGAGAIIDAFIEGTPSGGAPWQAPVPILGTEETYGHLGLTSEDEDLSGGDDFGDGDYMGFNGTTPIEVMYHDDPSDGSTEHIGATQVAYSIEISALQEAGDYSNTLTYICTPTY